MKTDEEYRALYLAGNQERDSKGNRLWKVTAIIHMYKLWECETAEGPTILAAREYDGTPRLQVQDGSPERNDEYAETFVSLMEWESFLHGWVLLGGAL